MKEVVEEMKTVNDPLSIFEGILEEIFFLLLETIKYYKYLHCVVRIVQYLSEFFGR
jgi:hypothetical protein